MKKDVIKDVGIASLVCLAVCLTIGLLISSQDPKVKATRQGKAVEAVKPSTFEQLAEITTTTVTPATVPVVKTAVNPDLAICSQALYDIESVIRSYYDAMRNYEDAYILNHEPYSGEAQGFGQTNEKVGDQLYNEQWGIFLEHCDKYVTVRRASGQE